MKLLRGFWRVVVALVYAAILAVSVDILVPVFYDPIPFKAFILIFVISALVLIVIKPLRDWMWIFPSLLAVGGITVAAMLYGFYSNGDYTVVDNGKSALYSDKKVLVLVPHQDDELLVAGGVIEEYLKYGSQVSLAFSTNGDAIKPGETRLTEALDLAGFIGIPREDVYFLGYGDRSFSDKHIYNSPADVLVPSAAGYTSTHALDEHPAYRQGQEYTRENMLGDIIALIEELKPDIIYCVEVEPHPDHSALSLFLDEAMAAILKKDSSYKPIIMKSSNYATAYYAVEDFYASNLISTVDPSGGKNFANVYDWEDRFRLPINGSGLSRSIYGCDAFRQFEKHKSQYVQLHSESAINGDKVFWLRDTTALSYTAQIETSSGNEALLNDFKLFDNDDLSSSFRNLGANTWVPDASDEERRASVTLEEASYIQRICLYDNPDDDSNVLNARITFDDGSCIETGKLRDAGATEFLVEKDNVSSFTVELLETEGDRAGITEIEAYSYQQDYGFDFIKLMDMNGNFVYDYYINEKGSEQFEIYAPGLDENFRVSADNPRCSVSYTEGIVSVKCPKNASCTISIASEDGELSDTVVISNPGRFMRETGPYLENLVRQFRKTDLQYCNSYQTILDLYHYIR